MAVDFNRSWKKACAAQNETEFVRSLAEILASKDGLGYILTLERDGAELCIEILDHVRLNFPFLISTILTKCYD